MTAESSNPERNGKPSFISKLLGVMAVVAFLAFVVCAFIWAAGEDKKGQANNAKHAERAKATATQQLEKAGVNFTPESISDWGWGQEYMVLAWYNNAKYGQCTIYLVTANSGNDQVNVQFNRGGPSFTNPTSEFLKRNSETSACL